MCTVCNVDACHDHMVELHAHKLEKTLKSKEIER